MTTSVKERYVRALAGKIGESLVDTINRQVREETADRANRVLLADIIHVHGATLLVFDSYDQPA